MNRSFLPSAVVLGTAVFWSVYWLPVRTIAGLGLDGAWGTGAITLAAALCLLPFLRRGGLTVGRGPGAAGGSGGVDRIGLLSVALGGAAFALYSIGFLYGKVALVVLLWFFSPVWSVLIARYVLRWHVPGLRLVAIAVGLCGLFVMLGGDGGWPLPRSLGEWMAFVGGLIWAGATAGMRLRSNLAPLPAALVFALGAAATAMAFAPFLEPLPRIAGADAAEAAVMVLITGGLWWGLSIARLMWAALRLDPARVGILLMPEVIFGALSAAVLAGERLSGYEIAGGALVVLCGVLEVWPSRAETAHGPAPGRVPPG